MKIGIVGLGLMGASFGRTVIKQDKGTVFGIDCDEQVMLKAELLSAINAPLNGENIKEVDILIFALYTGKFKEIAEGYIKNLKKGATVIDFCGNKRGVIKVMKELSLIYPDINFIGGHPMAGREFSGIDHSVTTLFNKASMLLVPVKCDIFIESDIKKYFLSLGFEQVVITDAITHDEIISYTSQLCHIVSNAFIKSPTAEKRAGYSAGSFRDLTRVARLNPEMWTELMIDNSDNLTKELDFLINSLSKYKKALESKDGDKLKVLLSEGNERKLMIESRKNK